MKYAEIKEKMTQGEWTIKSEKANMAAGAPVEAEIRSGGWVIVHLGKLHTDQQRFDAHAITTAVNNTYGKGIDPEAVPIMKIALEEWKRQIEKVISWGNAFLGEKFDEKMQRNLLRQCEHALTAAEGKN